MQEVQSEDTSSHILPLDMIPSQLYDSPILTASFPKFYLN
jgi:hypothetical protein